MSIPRSQIRLVAITGSIASIDTIANTDYSQPVTSSVAGGNNLETILASMAGAIKRIHGTGSFTAADAGVFTHEEAQFTGDLMVKGGDLRTTAAAATLFDENADTIYMGGAAEYVGIGANAGLVDFAGDVRMTGSLQMMGAGGEFIDRLDGGSLTIRGGSLTGSVGKVAVTLSGSDLRFDDGYRTGWDNDIKLATSANDWDRFKNIFGEASILQAISNAAALPTDAKFMYKVTGSVNSPALILGNQLQQVNGTHFSGSFSAVPTGSRNENVDVFLNGQLLVSKSYDSVNYDYDIAGNGTSITFNFGLQEDDFISVLVPVTVASVVDYVAANGTGGGGAGNGATNLDGLTDVVITSPSINQVLQYNGINWINTVLTGTQGPAGPTGATGPQGPAGASAASFESAIVSATALSGSVNLDVSSGQIFYYTSNSTANWTPNVRNSSSGSLNSLMAVGDSRTVTVMATQGAGGFFASNLQIDGASVSPKWAGGLSPTFGNEYCIDVYSYTIVKTASAAFTVFASVSPFS